ncbi:hypothetical protein C8R44DRAFT_656725, partial [Mycena epipterygia]
MAETSQVESSLQRGQACAYCRRRKMRCDGRRPVCGQCLRASRSEDCEYTDNQSRSRADILEEDIIRIESRIYELEHPVEAAGSSVFLHHPYKQPQRLGQMPSLSQVINSPGPSAPTPSSGADAWWNSSEPPNNVVETLLDTFLPYAPDWGFFLDPSRFRRDALLPLPIGHHSRPSPALLTTVYLIGITLSNSSTLKAHEKTFLSRALSSLPMSLSGLHPRKAMHALQTEILLSNYFYVSGRFLEARYHTTAAASLAVSSGLLQIQPSAVADAEEAERLDACWTTIILDKSWAVALAIHPNVQDSSGTLEMPWPENDTSVTVSQFLEGTEPPASAMSTKTLLAKAAILWERANNLVVGWKSDMRPQESTQFSTTFNALDTRTRDFLNTISSNDPAPNSPASDHRALVVGRSIAHAAVIQLHGTFAQTDAQSKHWQKCLTAAKSILHLIVGADLRDATFINPIAGAVWVTACEIVID